MTDVEHKDMKSKDDRRYRNASKSGVTVSRVQGQESSRGDTDTIFGPSKSYAADTQGKSQAGSDYNIAGTTSGDNEQTSESGSLSGPRNQSTIAPTLDKEEILRERQAQQVLGAPVLLKRLQMLERAVQQNAYHRQHLDYRDLPDLEPLSLINSDSENDAGNTLTR